MRVLSGIQPSGSLHIGNYFGSLKPNMELSRKAEESIYIIADLHALTSMQDPEKLRRYRRDAFLDCLGIGFDSERTILFFQSDVLEHTELLWILSTIAPIGLLERAVSYKEKVEKGIAPTVGLFTYPVLMAADILLYGATTVPVGRDQKQHLEIARDIAQKFNSTFGETLVIPEPLIREEVAVVPGIDGQKMSKSYGNTIPLFGSEKETEKAIMSIVTDSSGPSDPKDPETSVIFQIHTLFLEEQDASLLATEYKKGISYGEAKKRLLHDVLEHLRPLRERRIVMEAEIDIDDLALSGARKAAQKAQKTMESVRKAVGLK